MNKTTKSTKKRILSAALSFLSLCMILFYVPQISVGTHAASALTSIGLAEHGLKAYRDDWQYIYGNKGEVVNGKRTSDCSGLISAYFSDNGGAKLGGVTSQVRLCVQSGPIATLPRIHGLLITIANYDHVGIYLGNNIAVDNSDYGVNMKYGEVMGKRGWIQWHMMGNGVRYPTNGFYAFDGSMYYYKDRQYVINTTFTYGGTTYNVGNDGIVKNVSGTPIPVSSMWNEGFAAAAPIADLGETPAGTLGTVNTSALNIRNTPNATGSQVAVLYRGQAFYVQSSVDGSLVRDGSNSSSKWYYGETSTGEKGYVSSLYITLEGNTPPQSVSAPAFTYKDGQVFMESSTSGAAVYYTTDGSAPSANSTKYSGAVTPSASTTYRAVAVLGGVASSAAKLTVIPTATTGFAFSDIDPNHWFWKDGYLELAVTSGVFEGNGNGTFSPTKGITRAEFVTALAKMAGLNDETIKAYGVPSYKDAKNNWYSSYIAWAQTTGFVKGYTDNTFRPGSIINREEMCTIIARMGNLTSSGNSANFSDHKNISSWAQDAVYACKELGIISGNGGSNPQFAPRNQAARCEAAKVLVEYLRNT